MNKLRYAILDFICRRRGHKIDCAKKAISWLGIEAHAHVCLRCHKTLLAELTLLPDPVDRSLLDMGIVAEDQIALEIGPASTKVH